MGRAILKNILHGRSQGLRTAASHRPRGRGANPKVAVMARRSEGSRRPVSSAFQFFTHSFSSSATRSWRSTAQMSAAAHGPGLS